MKSTSLQFKRNEAEKTVTLEGFIPINWKVWAFRIVCIMSAAGVFCSEYNDPVKPYQYYSSEVCGDRFEFCLKIRKDSIDMQATDLDTSLVPVVIYLGCEAGAASQFKWRLDSTNATHMYKIARFKKSYYVDRKVTLVPLHSPGEEVIVQPTKSKGFNSWLELEFPLLYSELGYPDTIAWQVEARLKTGVRRYPPAPALYAVNQSKSYKPVIRFQAGYQFVGSLFKAITPGDTFVHRVGTVLANPVSSPPIRRMYWKTNHDSTWVDSTDELSFTWSGRVPDSPSYNQTRIIIQAVNQYGIVSTCTSSRVMWGLKQPVELQSPGGEGFRMGSGSTDGGDYAVRLSPYSIMTTEVTEEMYDAVMRLREPRYSPRSTLPADSVSWYEAIQFCNKLSSAAGLDTCYVWDYEFEEDGAKRIHQVVCDFSRNGFRLPTGAEWEYACRAGSNGAYWSSPEWWADSVSVLNERAWWESNSGWRRHPVAGKKSNAFGLYDMLGNVAEWCNDWYQAPYESHSFAVMDPLGPEHGEEKEVRGGGYNSGIGQIELYSRQKRAPHEIAGDIGFRCVRREP